MIPEEVTRVYVTFSPPAEPNGNISGYQVKIYRDDRLDFQIANLPIIRTENQTMTGVIRGLKGGYSYRILVWGPHTILHTLFTHIEPDLLGPLACAKPFCTRHTKNMIGHGIGVAPIIGSVIRFACAKRPE